MRSSSSTIPLPCIMGPTGAGKTASALALADRFPLAVINTDSRQVYRDFPLITAQPSPEERARCPHLLYGYLPASAKLGAGQYARAAGECILREHASGRLALAVGGTGLYFKALVDGLADIPDIPEHISLYWQERCAQEGSIALHALLAESDPLYAAKIHPNDKQRITRALEVQQATGKSFSQWHAQSMSDSPFKACKIGIGLPLDELTPLLAKRIDLMLAEGAIDEARAALQKEPDPTAPGWSGIGCAEIFQYLSGTLSLEECKSLWLKNTRAYAKRQLTWFRADPEIVWFS
ncbi:tRNA (adenosine(37)-N6)-dimethylallyltransferase MiaA, partial [Desulfovibrio sp. OttesenSCG-928-G15]|nr:tRNA (adenosine(37)-N6)-dimethylallyltransferase MiaA [Desulfovibrio sp. OttesenSCG-928-G15]